MNLVNLKTFIAVAETGSFLGAAERIYVTQSTVSVRIRSLEDTLGVYLFDRSKQGATLTADGQKFLKTAIAMMNLWEQSRLEIGLATSQKFILRIGAQVSLWDGYLTKWLANFREQHDTIAVRAEMASPGQLISQLVNNELDAIVLYRPQYRPGYEAHIIFDEELILVSTTKNDPDPLGTKYVFIYWGPDFQQDHSLHYPDIEIPQVSLDIGTLALEYIFNFGGSAYVPKRTVEKYIDSEQLYWLSDYPVFRYPVYSMFANSIDSHLKKVLNASLTK
jgi:DNA-binding transcriptional LysR family regulator